MLKVFVHKLNLFVAPLCTGKCTTAFSQQYQTGLRTFLAPCFLERCLCLGANSLIKSRAALEV